MGVGLKLFLSKQVGLQGFRVETGMDFVFRFRQANRTEVGFCFGLVQPKILRLNRRFFLKSEGEGGEGGHPQGLMARETLRLHQLGLSRKKKNTVMVKEDILYKIISDMGCSVQHGSTILCGASSRNTVVRRIRIHTW
jgi:hypothetical protein